MTKKMLAQTIGSALCSVPMTFPILWIAVDPWWYAAILSLSGPAFVSAVALFIYRYAQPHKENEDT